MKEGYVHVWDFVRRFLYRLLLLKLFFSIKRAIEMFRGMGKNVWGLYVCFFKLDYKCNYFLV